jgi:hypothetical protein
LIARKIASRCEETGGDAATAAAAAAREAADRCVADGALDIDSAAPLADPAVPRAVPLADAAALEAREAAASCDAALACSAAADPDAENMRGWLMMVATLFVGIAFQAVLQPPPAIFLQDSSRKAVSGAASPAPAPAEDSTPIRTWSTMNELTMFASLAMLVLLMTMRRATVAGIFMVRSMLLAIAFTVACSFFNATPDDKSGKMILLVASGIVIIMGLFSSFIQCLVSPSSEEPSD